MNFTSVFLLTSQSCSTSFSLPPRRSEAGESSLSPDSPFPTFIPALGDLVPRTPQLPGLDKSGDPGDPTFLRVTGTGARQEGLECPCPYPLPRIPKFAEHLNPLAKAGTSSRPRGKHPPAPAPRSHQARVPELPGLPKQHPIQEGDA